MTVEPPGLDAKALAVPDDRSATPSSYSIADDKEKGIESFPDDGEDDGHERGIGDKALDTLERVESAQYPTSFKLLGIVVAICLSIFLVALDMVGLSGSRAHLPRMQR
jgi:hypothetical protein